MSLAPWKQLWVSSTGPSSTATRTSGSPSSRPTAPLSPQCPQNLFRGQSHALFPNPYVSLRHSHSVNQDVPVCGQFLSRAFNYPSFCAFCKKSSVNFLQHSVRAFCQSFANGALVAISASGQLQFRREIEAASQDPGRLPAQSGSEIFSPDPAGFAYRQQPVIGVPASLKESRCLYAKS